MRTYIDPVDRWMHGNGRQQYLNAIGLTWNKNMYAWVSLTRKIYC